MARLRVGTTTSMGRRPAKPQTIDGTDSQEPSVDQIWQKRWHHATQMRPTGLLVRIRGSQVL